MIGKLNVFAFAIVGACSSLASADEIKLNGHTFRLPDGFSIELVAGPPLVDRPICADFDEQGRLYVADSSGSNESVEKQLELKPHRIIRLEDTSGDGRFDQSVVFADRMMFPEGTLWFDGSLYVAAPPSIWKLTDTDRDGKADRREEWFQGKTLTHCANDLHGPYLGPDGWFYWCKGAFAEQTYERHGKSPWVTNAAHIFRCRPDAPRDPTTGSVLTSAIEPVMTGGMANPVDVTFTAGGERIFTTTFLIKPSGGLRDGLIHAVYGGVYGRDRESLDEHQRTGDLMPILRHLGAAVPCGLTRYRSDVFGQAYRGNLFTCLFNLHKVSRHILSSEGATFAAQDEDFLVSDSIDFHPTDVLEDADGSLIVIDTGGWYKLCCPSSQLWKPDVLGAIYRIRRTGASRVQDPRGMDIQWSQLGPAELVGLLGDPRAAVQDRAVAALVEHGAASVPALMQLLGRAPRATNSGASQVRQTADANIQSRRLAVWALSRIDNPDARLAVRLALGDADDTVRQAAIHSISIWRDAAGIDRLVQLLGSDSFHNRRAAAEALGRIGEETAVPALLEAAGQENDRVLEHSLIYALIEIASARETRPGLMSSSSRIRRAALMALDQMDGRPLLSKDVINLLSSSDPVLNQTAAWIVDRHPEWGSAMVRFFRQQLRSVTRETESRAVGPASTDRSGLERRLARFASQPSVQQLIVEMLADATLPSEPKLIVLRAMAQSEMRELPQAWSKALSRILTTDNPQLVRQAVSVLRQLPSPKKDTRQLAEALRNIGGNVDAPTSLRLDALATVPGGLPEVDLELREFLFDHLDQELPVSTRAAAAEVLAKAKLHTPQLLELAERIRSVGPLELERLLDAFGRSKDERVGLALIAALRESTARSSLREETLQPRLKRFPPSVHARAKELMELVDADLANQLTLLKQLMTSMPKGDARRGQTVFHSSKAACAACHEIGYLGGDVGPDLTKIAQIRSPAALLEAILYPSASLVRDYLPVLVVTSDGKVHNGIVREQSSDELVLATGPNQQIRIPRPLIEEMRTSDVSVMPAGLDKQLTQQELADLLEFLLSTK